MSTRRRTACLRWVIVFICTGIFTQPAGASDACHQSAVYSNAKVVVSDGSEFSVETWFGDSSHAAVRHHRETVQTMAVEGPLAWAGDSEKAQLGPEFWKAFALGHQYHAFLLYFEKMFGPVEPGLGVTFNGQDSTAIGAEYPYGGKIFLVGGPDKPAGILMQLPDTPPIESRFSDWREQDGRWLPFAIRIDDGTATFDYRYDDVSVGERSSTWYLDEVKPPAIDEAALYRLHRRLLAAHCDGDSDVMAELSLDVIMVSNRGQLMVVSREDTRQRFNDVFSQVDYEHYSDLVPPKLTVSESGDIGWIGVQVNSAGKVLETGEPFDYQWSWIMLARKEGGRWLHAGNASNLLPARN